MKSIEVFDIINRAKSFASFNNFDTIHCPRCDTLQIPDHSGGIVANKSLYLLCYCQKCNSAYISEYNCNDVNKSSNGFSYYSEIKFNKAYPNSFKKGSFSDNIVSVSSDFIKIYNQALTADSFGLDEISGMGYRKALEFLIKDFLISINQEEKDKISSEKLSIVINRLSDENAKKFAHACRLLSNDQTHYIEHFGSKDTDNIKSLIEYIVNFINNYCLANKVLNS